MIKKIHTGGIVYIQPLDGTDEWYWGTDYISGDLYEAEELFRDGHRIDRNRLIFVHYPDGLVVEPVTAQEGQYFGLPAYEDGQILILLADFAAGEIRVLSYKEEVETVQVLPLSEIEDCYNLMLHGSPVCLTRQTADRFQMIWPDRADFAIAPQETFCWRDGDRLYFSRWYEDPDYREETVVRQMPDGSVLEQYPGSPAIMPGGRKWVLI